MGIFTNAVKQGNVEYNYGKKDINTTYNLGNGDHVIKVNGNGTNVTTGNGRVVIKAYGNRAIITTGKGNSKIQSVGNGVTISTGDGNNNITSIGDNTKIVTGNGNQKITSLGDNKIIKTGDGDDEIVFLGDCNDVDMGNGNNKLTFWGNGCNIKAGDGNDSITTFDQVYDKKEYKNISQYFIDMLPTTQNEKWTKENSTQIDGYTKRNFFQEKKIRTYENTYSVETILNRYINGVQQTTIDMGKGNNTANLTMGSGSKILQTQKDPNDKDTTTNIITYNKPWQIQESLGTRTEVKTETTTSKKFVFGFIG